MKTIRRVSTMTTLTLALMAGSAMTQPAAARGGWGGGGDSECAYRVQKWESEWRYAMQREGQGSWNERSARSELDRARADCCRSHGNRWSWCGDDGGVIPESRYVNPNDPDRIYLDRNRDGSYRGGNDWSNGLGGSHSGDGDRGGRHGGSDRGHDDSGGWQNDQGSGHDGSDRGRHNRGRRHDDQDRGHDDQGGW